MQVLERAASVAEAQGEVIEELGVGGLCAHPAEVVGRVHESAPKVELPHAVHDRAPGERIIRVRDPIREGDSARALAAFFRETKGGWGVSDCADGSGGARFEGLGHLTAL